MTICLYGRVGKSRGLSSHQTTGKVFSAEYAIYCKFYNHLELSPSGEAVNNRPYASPSFELVKLCKITAISVVIIIIIIIMNEGNCLEERNPITQV